MNISVPYLSHCGTVCYRSYRGKRSDAISAAVEELSAWRDGGTYLYHAEETDHHYRVSTDDMAAAGAAILLGLGDWYSLWCSGAGDDEGPCDESCR